MAEREVPYWDAFRDTALGAYLLDREQSFIAQHLQPITGPFRVLEIGACTGRVTLPLRDSINTVVIGSDIDFRAVTLFEARPGNHPAVVASAAELPFAPKSFDAIVAVQCFRYFDPVEFLQSCQRVLKTDGWLFLQAVNRLSYKRAMKRLVRRSASDSAKIFRAAHLLELLADHGFDVRGARGYNWLPFTPSVTRVSDSRLIWYAAHLEKGLRFERLFRISPWVLVAARNTTSRG